MDPRILSTVESGLPGVSLYELRLKWRDDGELRRLSLTLSLRLDLWKEVYYVEGAGQTRSFTTLASADSSWAHLNEVKLMPLNTLDANRAMELDVVLLVSPLGAQQRAWIDDYVSQANHHQRNELSLNIAGLLKNLFVKDKSPGNASAILVSRPFTINGLETRP